MMKTAEYYVVDVTEHVNEKVSEHFTISEFKCTDNSRVVVLNKALIDVLTIRSSRTRLLNHSTLTAMQLISVFRVLHRLPCTISSTLPTAILLDLACITPLSTWM